jgi:hypothetical protein
MPTTFAIAPVWLAISDGIEKTARFMECGGPAGTQTQLGSEPYLFWVPNYSPLTFVLFDLAPN